MRGYVGLIQRYAMIGEDAVQEPPGQTGRRNPGMVAWVPVSQHP